MISKSRSGVSNVRKSVPKTTRNHRKLIINTVVFRFLRILCFRNTSLAKSMIFNKRHPISEPKNGSGNKPGKTHTHTHTHTHMLVRNRREATRFGIQNLQQNDNKNDWIQESPVTCVHGMASCQHASPGCQNGSVQPAKWQLDTLKKQFIDRCVLGNSETRAGPQMIPDEHRYSELLPRSS